MVYLKKDFERALETICPNGFKKEKDVSIFTSIDRGIVKRIHISYNSYFPHSALIRGVSAELQFDAIEKILSPVLRNFKINNDQYTVGKSLQAMEDINYRIFETDIHDEASFLLVANEVKKIIEKGVLPFFDKYSSLLSVADLLADKKPEEIVPYIQGPILLPKTILILRESRHPEYRKKLKEFFIVLKEYAEKKESYKPFLGVFNELFSEDLKTE